MPRLSLRDSSSSSTVAERASSITTMLSLWSALHSRPSNPPTTQLKKILRLTPKLLTEMVMVLSVFKTLKNLPSDTLSSPLKRRSRSLKITAATLRPSLMSLEDSSRDSTRTAVVTSKKTKLLSFFPLPTLRWVWLTSPPPRMMWKSGSKWPTPTVMVPFLSRNTKTSSSSPSKRLVSESRNNPWSSERFSVLSCSCMNLFRSLNLIFQVDS